MPDTTRRPIIIAFVPVLHLGYINFFKAYPKAKELYLVEPDFIDHEEIKYLKKDIRALRPNDIIPALKGLRIFEKIEVLTDKNVTSLDTSKNLIVLPDEDISHVIANKFMKAKTEFFSVFLRWDRRKLENVNFDQKNTGNAEKHSISKANQDIKLMAQAVQEALGSTDIWRRVGAVIVLKSTVLDKAHNSAEPSKYTPWIEGDPRSAFHRGVAIEMSTHTHAEALLIARAARHGVSLQGAKIYVTDFPCPACAKLIAHSGINRLYYMQGYAVLDGQRVLDEYGVQISQVNIPDLPGEHPEVWVPYKKP